jgi:hypothetical protein
MIKCRCVSICALGMPADSYRKGIHYTQEGTAGKGEDVN